MNYERKIKSQITKKRNENKRLGEQIQDLQDQFNANKAFIEGLEHALTAYSGPDKPGSASDLRPGSQLDKIRKVLAEQGKPMPITEICRAIGKEPTKSTKQSITGSLGRLVRENRVFTRPSPGTFGLFEWETDSSDANDDASINSNEDQEGDNVRVLTR